MTPDVPKLHPAETAKIDATAISNWTPEQQMAHMLDLCEAQMESALTESDVAVDALIKAFTGLVESARAMGAVAKKLPTAETDEAVALNQQIDTITRQMSAAIVAFQFY